MADGDDKEMREMRKELRQLSRQVARLVRMERLQVCTMLTIDEASALTGYARSYLYKLTATGELPCCRPTRRHILIEREKLEEWLRRNN